LWRLVATSEMVSTANRRCHSLSPTRSSITRGLQGSSSAVAAACCGALSGLEGEPTWTQCSTAQHSTAQHGGCWYELKRRNISLGLDHQVSVQMQQGIVATTSCSTVCLRLCLSAAGTLAAAALAAAVAMKGTCAPPWTCLGTSPRPRA
jgi:hypothetical protein